MEPVSHNDFFTKKAVAQYVANVTPLTLTTYIKNNKLFEPRYVRPDSNSANPRKYYSCADAMRISLILHGAILMKNIHDLLEQELPNRPAEKKAILQSSFSIVRNQIAQQIDDPIDLSSYLIDEPLEQVNNG